MFDFAGPWKSLLEVQGTQSVELLASLREEAMNHYLGKHFEFDRDKYTVVINKVFSENGKDRKFTLKLSATKPFAIDLTPFTVTKREPWNKMFDGRGGWFDLDVPEPGPALFAPQQDQTPSNIRLSCPEFTFELTWDKLDGSGTWDPWKVTLKVIGEAQISLQKDADGYYLQVVPRRIKFDKVVRDLIAMIRKQSLSKHKGESKALAKADDEKFKDLLIIALNIAATRYVPQFVKAVRLPVPIVAKKQLSPVFLNISNNMATVGLTLNARDILAENAPVVSQTLAVLKQKLEADIQKAGGFTALVVKPGQDVDNMSAEELKKLKFRSAEEIVAQLHELNAFNDMLAASIKGRKVRLAGKGSTVPDGVAAGVNEYFLDELAVASLPAPVERSTEWLSLGAVRGRAHYWMKLPTADISISGTQVQGAVAINIGGALEGCIRKFWDCSWHWECARLNMAIKGMPGIELRLASGDGVTFTGKVIGKLTLETNLPFPFNKVAEGAGSVVWEIVKGILNLALSLIVVEIIPGDIAIPDQNTKLRLRDFRPFSVKREIPSGLLESQKKYIGYGVGVTAIK